MTPPEPAIFGEVVAFLVGLGVIVAGLRWLVPIVAGFVRTVVAFTRAQVAFLESWHGTPIRHDASGAVVEEAHPGIMARLLAVQAGQDEHAGKLAEVLERVAAHDTQIAQIAYETRPNGGNSAYDQLMKQLRAMGESVDTLRELAAGTIQELTELRGEYERALRVNHPSYDPDRYRD